MKFEKDIKDKLEQRKLQPSDDAWEVLQKRFDDVSKNNKDRKGFWWLGLAASIVGVLIMVNVLTKADGHVDEPVIVDTEASDAEMDIKVIEPIETIDSPIINSKKDPLKNNSEMVKVEAANNVKEQKEKLVVIEKIPLNNKVMAQEDTIQKAPVVLSDEDKKVQEVVTKILELQETNVSITDAQIDSMLYTAQKDLNIQTVYNNNTKKVDAMALLQDVEFEIEKSFRDKVFEALKSSYKSVKTAVAERNN